LRDAADGVTIRHTTNVRSRIDHATQVLGLADRHFRRLGETLDELARVVIDDDQADEFIRTLVPFPTDATDLQRRRVEATRDQLAANFLAGVGAELSGHTAWGAFSAVTEFTSHQRPVRGATPRDQAERRSESILLGGPAHQLEQRAFEAALRLTRAA